MARSASFVLHEFVQTSDEGVSVNASRWEIPSRTANFGRPTRRARLKEPKQERLSEAGQCDLTPRTAQSRARR